MIKKLLLAALAALVPAFACAQAPTCPSNPGLACPAFVNSNPPQVLTAAQWNNWFLSKQPALGYTPVNRAGDTMQGKLTFTPSTSAGASFNIPVGTAPGSPNNGDMWVTAGGLFFQAAGITVGPITSGNGSINSGTGGQLGYYAANGSTISGTPNATISGGALALGASGTAGSITMGNASSGTVALQPVTGTLGTVTASLPANTGTVAELNLAQTWSAPQTFGSGDLVLNGSSSGALTVKPAAVAGTNTITLPAGTTDFSATGGTSQVVKQTTAGGAFTVGQLQCSDLSNAGTGCSSSSNVQTLMMGGNLVTSISAANTVYEGNGGNTCGTVTTAGCFIRSPISGTVKNFYLDVNAAGSGPGSGQSYTGTLYVNGSSTSVTCQIGPGQTACNDTTHTAAVTAGQSVSMQFVTSSGANSSISQGFSLEITNP